MAKTKNFKVCFPAGHVSEPSTEADLRYWYQEGTVAADAPLFLITEGEWTTLSAGLDISSWQTPEIPPWKPAPSRSTIASDEQQVSQTSKTKSEAPDRSVALFERFWWGEVSLPLTFWGLAFGGRVVYNILFLVATDRLKSGAPQDVVVYWLLAISYVAFAVFSLVAVARSAVRYTGPKLWRGLAQAAVVLGILRLLWDVLAFLGIN